jgi:hypothetical protein
MISADQVNSLLLEACPSFAEKYRASLESWGDDCPSGIRSDFISHVLALHRENRCDEFSAVAHVIERLHVEGDDEVQNLATIEILESIQNIWANNDADPEEFGRVLLPESRRWWDELNAYWRGERNYVGEGLQKEMTAEDIAQVKANIRAYNERLRTQRDNGVQVRESKFRIGRGESGKRVVPGNA